MSAGVQQQSQRMEAALSSASGGGGGKPSQPNPLAKKLSRILESRYDEDKDTMEALRVLSEFMTENTLQTRRTLRSDLERRTLELSESFTVLLGAMASRVEDIQAEVAAMRECCRDMQLRLNDTKAKTSGLLRETADMKAKSKKLEMKAAVVDAFLERFQLSNNEVKILSVGAANGAMIDSEFFDALRHVQSIHEDCKVLLRSSQQRAGLEIMERMAMRLEEGYERLYHWTQSQCRSMTGDLPTSSSVLCRALSQLKERAILYKYCVDEYVLARRGAVVQSFIDALTRGSNGRHPIELVSHDPVRYVGDMLSWLHQALATEKDHINGLLGEDDSGNVSLLLGSITEGACRPLRVRVEQVLLATNDPVSTYQLVNLVRYYSSVFTDILLSSAPLVSAVNDLMELQSKMFFNCLTVHTSKLLESNEPPNDQLAPPTKLAELLLMLQTILSAHDVSMSTVEDHKLDLNNILSTCLEPMIQYCHESASSLHAVDMAVFMVNCLNLIHNTLSLYEFTEPALEKLDAQIQAHMDALVDQQASHFLVVGGLVDCYKLAQAGEQLSSEVVSALPKSTSRLTELLSSPDSFLLSQLDMLTGSRSRDTLRQRSFQLFLTAYQQIHQSLEAAVGSGNCSQYLQHSPAQAQTLIIN